MRDDQILSTPLILGYAMHRSIQPGCWRTRKGFRRMFPTGSQSPVRAVRYSIKNRQIQIGWKAGYVVQELRNRKGISTGRIVKEICEKPPTWIKEGWLDLGGNMRNAFSHLCDITAKNFADFAELGKEHVVAAALYLAEIIFIQPAFCR